MKILSEAKFGGKWHDISSDFNLVGKFVHLPCPRLCSEGFARKDNTTAKEGL
jgi:hypothetical protein